MKFVPTQAMIKAAEAVFMTMAAVKTIEPVVLGYKKEILAKNEWPVAQDWVEKGLPGGAILDPNDTYLMSEDHFAMYQQQVNAARINAGLYVDDPSKCSHLVVKHLEVEATANLINVMATATGFDYQKLMQSKNALENVKKAKELTLKLLAPFVRDSKELMPQV